MEVQEAPSCSKVRLEGSGSADAQCPAGRAVLGRDAVQPQRRVHGAPLRGTRGTLRAKKWLPN